VKVIETALVPKTRIVGNLFLPTETERTEAIARRIIEVPADEEHAERLRDPRSGFVGVADVPPIAGRSPSYLARQIFDIQQGTRRGSAVDLMKLAVAKLNADDITAIVAYVASKFPPDPEDTAAAEEFRSDYAYNNANR
jgi:hypothetical protein